MNEALRGLQTETLASGLSIRRQAAGGELAELLKVVKSFWSEAAPIEVRHIGNRGLRAVGVNIVNNKEVTKQQSVHHVSKSEAYQAIAEAVPTFGHSVDIRATKVDLLSLSSHERFLMLKFDRGSNEFLGLERKLSLRAIDDLGGTRTDWAPGKADATIAFFGPKVSYEAERRLVGLTTDYLGAGLTMTLRPDIAA